MAEDGLCLHGVVELLLRGVGEQPAEGVQVVALVTNPAGRTLPTEFLSALHAVPVEALNAAAEYNPGEIVMWVGVADQSAD
ncbi:hypothetical protein ACWDU9_26735 [Streptomyces cellulosae]